MRFSKYLLPFRKKIEKPIDKLKKIYYNNYRNK